MRYPIMVEAFNGVHLRPMLESVMSTKLRSVSWGTSNELKSKRERQRHTEAKERQGRKKQCWSLLTLTELWKQSWWYEDFLLGFGGKRNLGKGRVLGYFCSLFCTLLCSLQLPHWADRSWNPDFPQDNVISIQTYNFQKGLQQARHLWDKEPSVSDRGKKHTPIIFSKLKTEEQSLLMYK